MKQHRKSRLEFKKTNTPEDRRWKAIYRSFHSQIGIKYQIIIYPSPEEGD